MRLSSFLNQTDPSVLEKFLRQAQAPDKTMGTGMFAVPKFEGGKMTFKIKLVKDISYDKCVDWGESCHAFKWIPNELMSFDEVVQFRCVNEGARCYHINNCQGACLCLNDGGIGYCRSNNA